MPTVMTGRPSILKENTLAVIIAGVWIDGATWTETGKFWNDAGDGAGTVFTGRAVYSGQTWNDLGSQTWNDLGSQTWNDLYSGPVVPILIGRIIP